MENREYSAKCGACFQVNNQMNSRGMLVFHLCNSWGDQTGFTNHVNWFCVCMVRLKGLLRLAYLKPFFSVFYFLNNLIPFLMGKETLYNRFSLNWIFTSSLKLPQLAELSLTLPIRAGFHFFLFSESDWFSGYFFLHIFMLLLPCGLFCWYC